MLRMRDYRCESCGREWEELVRIEAQPRISCCGQPATRIWRGRGPGLSITPAGYNTAAGAYVTGTRDRDRQLTKKNSWIPSKTEVEELLHTPMEAKRKVGLDKEKIKRIAMKKASELHGVGKYPRPPC